MTRFYDGKIIEFRHGDNADMGTQIKMLAKTELLREQAHKTPHLPVNGIVETSEQQNRNKSKQLSTEHNSKTS